MQASEGAFLRECEWSSGAFSLQSVCSEEESRDSRELMRGEMSINLVKVHSCTSAAGFRYRVDLG